jgi:hypothetical protein
LALSDLNCELKISMGTARSHWALPGLNRER